MCDFWFMPYFWFMPDFWVSDNTVNTPYYLSKKKGRHALRRLSAQ
jgi:hypothetical protein